MGNKASSQQKGLDKSADWGLEPLDAEEAERVQELTEALEARDLLGVDGLYRANAPISEVQSVLGYLQNGKPVSVLERAKPLALSDGLRAFLRRRLPLLGTDNDRSSEWLPWVDSEGSDEDAVRILQSHRGTLRTLPVLVRLFDHWSTVLSYSEENHASEATLAEALGPVLLDTLDRQTILHEVRKTAKPGVTDLEALHQPRLGQKDTVRATDNARVVERLLLMRHRLVARLDNRAIPESDMLLGAPQIRPEGIEEEEEAEEERQRQAEQEAAEARRRELAEQRRREEEEEQRRKEREEEEEEQRRREREEEEEQRRREAEEEQRRREREEQRTEEDDEEQRRREEEEEEQRRREREEEQRRRVREEEQRRREEAAEQRRREEQQQRRREEEAAGQRRRRHAEQQRERKTEQQRERQVRDAHPPKAQPIALSRATVGHPKRDWQVSDAQTLAHLDPHQRSPAASPALSPSEWRALRRLLEDVRGQEKQEQKRLKSTPAATHAPTRPQAMDGAVARQSMGRLSQMAAALEAAARGTQGPSALEPVRYRGSTRQLVGDAWVSAAVALPTTGTVHQRYLMR